ncbi:MAG: hypothetical protein KatS3mg053_0831 [Candidatus Roseilinea sp.]|nr:MAG: hypothetical protein KatS3mg053_0831 [Candidatus Roseilinea sp.]
MNGAASSSAASASASLAVRLRAFLVAHFSRNELELLCLDLHVDPEDVPGIGTSKEYWAAQIVLYFQHRDALPELIRRCRALRPNAPWDELDEPSTTAPHPRSVTVVVGFSVPDPYRKLDIKQEETLLVYRLGVTCASLGDLSLALKHLQHAFEAYRTNDDIMGQVDCLKQIGDLYMAQRNAQCARDYYERALALLRSLSR